MSSRSDSRREYETSDQLTGCSAVPESSEIEPGGLIFYHMDLYGSKERFDIFPEELSAQGERSLGDTRRESALSSEKFQQSQEAGYDLEKEVAELAKMYGLDEDREKELELLGGRPEMAESRWPSAHTEKARSQGSVYNASKSSSSVKDQSQSTKQRGLPGKASQDEDESKARAEDEAESPIRSGEGLSTSGISDEWNSQAISEEEESGDVFCSTCKIPIRAFDKLFGEHKDHEVTKLPNAMESEKEEIHKNMCKLEEQIAQTENFASHLEEIFITVEENFGRQEENFEVHYNDAVQVLAQKYEEQLEALGEEKRQKLEALYGQLVSCGEHLDTCKELTDITQELYLENDKANFMKAAITMVDRLEEFLKKEVDLELSTVPDFEERVMDFSEVEQLMNSINIIPAPCAPVINPQAPNAATGTSLRVCWSLFSDDTVESYQLSYKTVNNERRSDEQPGTYFCLNEDTAHPLLAILDDGFTIACDELENPECDLPVYDNSFTRCIGILGSLIPFPGKHYWEVEAEEDTEYRIGVAFENTPRHGYLGANNSSWCMRHIITPSRHKYEFLHSGMTPDIRITLPPRRIGILLDYENCRLSFFNADIAQHLYTFNSHFQHYVHPCFALETPGILRIRTGIAVPPWTALP
ncbi:fibronectin type III and SPRY domain-containing protein 2 isoform X2 [Pezoporus flaviventris]|uniref:fibronectin type III and SPRY domain-containing protein 2 isoform X2 n=1 Tax=Pezoporus flaviventris TaxID=889875 RepID=UPI002AB15721|nr:fibronectin type III and SPRY domain-containing protein 2 isoform X2 [Pezoporus flaviventris]